MSFSSVTLLSPAKVNLALHVIGQDAETGYHFLDSVVCFPHWGDFITLEPADDMSLEFHNHQEDIPLGNDNLILKAYNLLCDAVEKPLPKMRISVRKNIPTQAGLGGGSSNAASCLLMWQKLFLPDLSRDTLKEIALKVGADVPVCLYRKPCLMKSYGEDITPLPQTGITYYMVIAKPPQGADTCNIFSQLTTKNNPALSDGVNLDQLIHHTLENGRNDLASAAKENTPDIQKIHDIFAHSSSLKYDVTGSGSASFALFYNEEAAHQAVKTLKHNMANIFALQTKVIL